MDRDAEHLRNIKTLLQSNASEPKRAVGVVMNFLHTHREDYHWVGIYELKGGMLKLGPYVGPETDHQVIAVGQGVCGTAVKENQNQIIDDVRALTNYLACNLETRSEIVVLIRDARTGGILGQIDVDGTRVRSFNRSEEGFLTSVAELLAPLLPLS